MKKLFLRSAILVATTLAVSHASALSIDTENIKPYAGVDYKYLSGIDKVEFDGLSGLKNVADEQANVLGVTFGVQVNDYVGIEASYGKSVERLKSVSHISDSGVYTTMVDDELTDIHWNSSVNIGKISFEHITVGLTGQYPIADKTYVKGLLGASWQRFAGSSINFVDSENGAVVDQTTLVVEPSSNNDAVFAGKIGVGYQASEHSLFEINYIREGKLNGLGLQYKYLF